MWCAPQFCGWRPKCLKRVAISTTTPHNPSYIPVEVHWYAELQLKSLNITLYSLLPVQLTINSRDMQICKCEYLFTFLFINTVHISRPCYNIKSIYQQQQISNITFHLLNWTEANIIFHFFALCVWRFTGCNFTS